MVVRRRRECQNCHRRFTTYERVEESPLRVIKKDGRREPFDRRKIRSGVERACWNLPISPTEMDALVARVERTIYDHYEQEINSHEVGEMVMHELRDLDQVAYVRFASVYREFKEAGEFIQLLKEFVQGQREAQET
jgi:transcriptional repressor NrdR